MAALSVVWSPVRALGEVARERRVFTGFMVVAVCTLLYIVNAVIDALTGVTASGFSQQALPGLPPGFYDALPQYVGIGLIANSAAGLFLSWLLVTLLMQLATSFFGGNGPISSMFAVVGVATMPYVLLAPLQILSTVLQAALGPDSTGAAIVALVYIALSLAALVWYVALVVIGAAQARNVGYGPASGSCAISCVGLGLIGIAIVVAFVVIFSLASAAQ